MNIETARSLFCGPPPALQAKKISPGQGFRLSAAAAGVARVAQERPARQPGYPRPLAQRPETLHRGAHRHPYRLDRVGHRTAPRCDRRKIGIQRVRPAGEMSPQDLRRRHERPQPVPHRLSQTRHAQMSSDTPIAPTLGPLLKGRHDPLGVVPATNQAAIPKQNVRLATAMPTNTTARPPHHLPIRPAQHPLLGVTPRAQFALAQRTSQPTAQQGALDRLLVTLYHEHRCLQASLRGPSRCDVSSQREGPCASTPCSLFSPPTRAATPAAGQSSSPIVSLTDPPILNQRGAQHLVGQPTLNRQLRMGTFRGPGPAHRHRLHLKPMDLAESAAYLRHHLTLAGRDQRRSSRTTPIVRLHRVANGLPRALQQRRHRRPHRSRRRLQRPRRRRAYAGAVAD